MPIYFCRHGQTHWNQSGLIQGQLDSRLTDEGKAQAYELANKAKQINIQFIVCSDLGRAIETATIVANLIHCKFDTMFDIRERHFGELQSHSRKARPQLWDEFDRKHLKDRLNIDGAETATQVAERIMRATSLIDKKFKHKNVLVVGHGEWLRILLNINNKLQPWSNLSHLPDNCEIIQINNNLHVSS